MINLNSVLGSWEVGFPNLLAMGTPGQTAANPWLQFVPFILVLGIFYFIILLPMKKRQQKVQAFLAALKVNDRVITSGGIYGTITKVSDASLQLQVANNVRIEVSRAAIVGYQGQEPVGDALQSKSE
jgi:preprotein translocase subunit YajC